MPMLWSVEIIQELFGPIVTVYVYEDNEWESTLELVNNTSARMGFEYLREVSPMAMTLGNFIAILPHFEYYFKKKPHIIRKTRNGVAVLDMAIGMDAAE